MLRVLTTLAWDAYLTFDGTRCEYQKMNIDGEAELLKTILISKEQFTLSGTIKSGTIIKVNSVEKWW